MEIRDNNPLEARAREVLKFDITRSSREAIEASLPERTTELAPRDEVKLSPTAQEAIAREERVDARTEDHRIRIRELKAEHDEGTLNTPERIEQSANRMLLGE